MLTSIHKNKKQLHHVNSWTVDLQWFLHKRVKANNQGFGDDIDCAKKPLRFGEETLRFGEFKTLRFGFRRLAE
ncbi:unnamed protein product [Arabidopsis halleri]